MLLFATLRYLQLCMCVIEIAHIISCTAKRIVERLGIQTSHRLSKFDRSVFLILKAISYFFGDDMAWFFI